MTQAFISKDSFKEEVNQVLKDLTDQYGKEPWFISGGISSDDHGIHVVIKVKADDESRVRIVHPNKHIKVCVILKR